MLSDGVVVTDALNISLTRGYCVLVIEADPVIRGWLCQILRTQAFNVSAAGSLKEALVRVSAAPAFSVIVCDYYLPDGTCLDLLGGLRRHEGKPVPVLLTSGSGIQKWPGGNGLEALSKTFTAEQLLAALKRLLHAHPADRQEAKIKTAMEEFAPSAADRAVDQRLPSSKAPV